MLAALALAAGDVQPVAQAFGAREAVSQISLSPDGTHIAVIAPHGRGEVLEIGDLTGGGALTAVLSSSGDPDHLQRCDWTTPTRLVCAILLSENAGLSQRLGYTRLIALDSSGGNVKVLAAQAEGALGFAQRGGAIIDLAADDHGGVLIMRDFVPEQSTGTLLAAAGRGLGLERVDTRTLARSIVEQPRSGAATYISDGHGTVRLMAVRATTGTGLDRDTVSWFYRKPDDHGWQPLSRVVGGAGFQPYAVDRDRNVAYGFDRKDGRAALFRVMLDGSMTRELVLERPDVDVDGLVEVGRQARVVGASFATDRRQTQFFDPDLAHLQAALGRALPDAPLVSFVDASADESKLLLFIGSDRDPGRYYLFDKATHHLAEVLPVRPELAHQTLAPVRAITFPAADGTAIPAYLTLPPGSDGRNLPAIVLPHGGPGARDEWGFDWLSQFYAARGFAVLQPNFRGSTGYGEGWFQKNGFQSWQVAIGDVNDAGRYLQRAGIAAPGRLAIMGWSYGGYAALQSAVLDPALFKAIVAVAPVTDLEMLRGESRDFSDHALVDTFIGSGAHVRAGSPLQNARAITAPVLLFHGDRDVNVGVGESRAMAARLREAGRSVDYVEFRGLDHYLLDPAARAELLARSDTFLRAKLGL
ncbi:alpha/beta hydrolase family protein [Sphingomonas sp.]|uniref:alpha/beta hydrolase family protein n=1 Tax=Sphingomonas sp. TaxID=28214 RepID=UPI003CC5B8C6